MNEFFEGKTENFHDLDFATLAVKGKSIKLTVWTREAFKDQMETKGLNFNL